MTDTALFEKMINRYNELSYTHNYIYGFYFQNVVYMVDAAADLMPYILRLDKASRGAGYSLRFCPNRNQKAFLLSKGAYPLCSKDFFETSVRESKYNKGEVFEKMVTEYFGQVWEKDTIPFWVQGDINLEGLEVQIKLDGATLLNTKQIEKFKSGK